LIDYSFIPGAGWDQAIRDIAIQSDGKIIAVWEFTSYGGFSSPTVTRINTNGTVDSTFNVWLWDQGWIGMRTVAIQSDGKVLVGWDFFMFNNIPRQNIVRLNTDGSVDTTFISPTNGPVYAITLTPNGKILIWWNFSTVIGGVTRENIAQLNSDGSLDTSFDTTDGFNNIVTSIALQSDGKILVGWDFTDFASTTANRVARLESNGSLDTTFILGNGADQIVSTIKVATDGSIFIGGDFTSFDGNGSERIAKLTSQWAFDSSFTSNTSSIWLTQVFDMHLQPDGKVIVVGVGGGALARFNVDGSVDASFNVGAGIDYMGYTLWVQADGKVIVGGMFWTYSGTPRNTIVRLLSDDSGSCVPGNFLCPVFPPIVCNPKNAWDVVCITSSVVVTPEAVTLIVTWGKVGINTDTPQYALDVKGTLRAGTVLTLSDARLKSSITRIDNALAKIRQIHGYEFTWKKDGTADMGVLAQEIETVFAQIVSTDSNGYKTVQYNALLAPIIEAIHEIDTIIQKDLLRAQDQKTRIDALSH
jgi:uncharacterized delta-60 repeat protein